MTAPDWTEFAKAWLAELCPHPPSPESDVVPTGTESDVGQAIVMMNFTADPDQQWQFIRSAVACAKSDDELGHIAAGPVEHLLGRHGESLIARVEAEAAADQTFARMLTGVRQHMMADEVWARVQAIQGKVSDPLPG